MMIQNPENILFLDDIDLSGEWDFTAEERDILSLINNEVAGVKSLDEILDFIFEEMGKIIPCDRLDLAFLVEEEKRMELYYVRACYEPVHLKKGFVSDIIGGSIQRVFQSGCTSIIRDMRAHAEKNPQSDSARLLVREEISSSMVCPLVVSGRPVGMLLCRSRKPDAYGEREIRLQLAFAARLGQAVEKAYHIEQLSSAMDSYMEMLGFVSHELKNPISAIIMLGKTLAGGYFGAMGEKQKETAERIVKKAEYLLGLAEEYLNLAKFESGEFEIHPRPVDFFHDVTSHSLEVVAPSIIEKGITIEQLIEESIPPITCDPQLMKIAVTNLLSNAVKYGVKGGAVRLYISLVRGQLRVAVWNEGPGFPESEKIRLFRRFSKLQTPELLNCKGHGVGLYVTWRIIRLHGGRIWANSRHGEWAEFCFEIPPLLDQCLLSSWHLTPGPLPEGFPGERSVTEEALGGI